MNAADFLATYRLEGGSKQQRRSSAKQQIELARIKTGIAIVLPT
jgi:hypothetical protein